MTGFTLHKEGEPWEESFHSIRQAVRFVRSLPDHEGELIVLNSAGKEISHISVEEPGASKKPGGLATPGGHIGAEAWGRSGGAMGREDRRRHKHGRRRTSRRSRGKALPWLRWLLIALVVAAVVVFLLWQWPKGFVPM